jgi:hypothetical protein
MRRFEITFSKLALKAGHAWRLFVAPGLFRKNVMAKA